MPRTKSIEKIRAEEQEFLEKMKKDYDLPFGPAAALLAEISGNYLKEMKPYKFCEAYLLLPGGEKEDFFRKMKFAQKDFEFWKECRLNASQLGIGSLSTICAEQMIEIATDLRQLSEIYINTLNEETRELALGKMKKIVKEQKRV